MAEMRLTYDGANGVAHRVILVDENGDPYVASGGSGGGAANDREVVVTVYRATASGTGFSSGDTITAMRVLDVDGATITQVGTTAWYNETTAAAIATAPSAASLSLAGGNPLTDAQLRATAVPVSGPLTDTQLRAAAVPVSGPVTDGQLGSKLGQPTDSAAGSDTGTFSAIALIKRGLQNWTTLLGRVPAAVTPGLLPVDTLGTVGVARQLAAGATSANTALTTTARRISICATGAAIRYAIGTGAQTASSTSHYIASGERLDLAVPASAQIAVIRAGSTDGVLEVTELV